jgi:radical SAM enzyme (TIGR01210 family)
MHYPAAYPASSDERDRFVLALRRPRQPHDVWRYQDLIVEDERTDEGRVARVGTVLLTGRECPWRCLMCDLWRGTVTHDTPAGAITAQIAEARREIERRGETVRCLKLYNAGSFFDPRAVPEEDYGAIAAALLGIERVIVESHPALVGPRVDMFLDALAGSGAAVDAPRLEVAMGLETAHPAALDALNKRMTVADFTRAAGFLRDRRVDIRVFLLISPPGIPRDEQATWLATSIDVAFASGASVVSLIPTRGGNGALDALAAAGVFRQPNLSDIERAIDDAHASRRSRGRILVDLWDLERFATCPRCLSARRARLHTMNLEQRFVPRATCVNPHCEPHDQD